MNDRVIINLNKVRACKFRHLFTYELLAIIVRDYDFVANVGIVSDKAIIKETGTSAKTYKKALDELIKHDIIRLKIIYSNTYTINWRFVRPVDIDIQEINLIVQDNG